MTTFLHAEKLTGHANIDVIAQIGDVINDSLRYSSNVVYNLKLPSASGISEYIAVVSFGTHHTITTQGKKTLFRASRANACLALLYVIDGCLVSEPQRTSSDN